MKSTDKEQNSLLGGSEVLGNGDAQSIPSLDDITFGDNIKKPDRIYKATINDIIETITNPAYMEVIAYLRSRQTKEERNIVKNGLKYFLMGRFTGKRSNDSMEYMVGCCLDYDNVPDPFHFIQKEMPKYNFVWAVFISPSGSGIKVICLFDRLVKDIEEYRKVYTWVQRIMDKALNLKSDFTSDPARAVYISYYPNIYVNPRFTRLPVDLILKMVKVRDEKSLDNAIQQHKRPEYVDNKEVAQTLLSVDKKENSDKSVQATTQADYAKARVVVSKLAQIRFDYSDFIKIGLALYSGFGERGKELWLLFADNPNYNDTPASLSTHWRSFSAVRNVKLATVFYIGAKYGCN